MMTLSSQFKKIVASSALNVGFLMVLILPAHALDLTDSSDSTVKANAAIKSQPQRSVLLSVGQASQSTGEIRKTLASLGYTGISVSDDEEASGWSLGYRHPVGRRFSADIQYLQQGKTNPVVQATLPLGTTNDQAAKETAESMPKRGEGLSVLAVYHHPLTKKFTLQVGLGAFAWESKRTASVGNSTYTSESDGVNAILQLGVSYPVTARTRLEAQWQHTDMPDEAVDRLSLGIAVNF